MSKNKYRKLLESLNVEVAKLISDHKMVINVTAPISEQMVDGKGTYINVRLHLIGRVNNNKFNSSAVLNRVSQLLKNHEWDKIIILPMEEVDGELRYIHHAKEPPGNMFDISLRFTTIPMTDKEIYDYKLKEKLTNFIETDGDF